MLKKLVLVMLVMLFITANAYAVKNDVHPFTEIPPIVKGACSQAGSLSLTFENATELSPKVAEVVGRLSPGVTLCQPIDMYVRIADTTSTVGAPKVSGVVQQEFVATGEGGKDVVFRVIGSVGSDEIRILPLNGTLQANNTGMKIVLFDSEGNFTNTELVDASKVNYNASEGEFRNATSGAIMNTAAMNAAEALRVMGVDNALCVLAAADYAAHEVRIYLESAPKVYTFSPADSVIAIVGTKPISEVPQKKALTAPVPLAGDQGGASGCDKAYYDATGMCETYDAGMFGHYALDSGTGFQQGTYLLEMEILVNGAAGDKGAYFAALPTGIQLVANRAQLTQAYTDTASLGNIQKFLGSGATTMLNPVPGCVRSDEEKITKVKGEMEVTAAMVGPAIKFLRFHVPTIAVPGLAGGDVVTLKVTLKRGRCQTVYSGSRNLFTMVDKCSTTAAPAGSLFFPYFAGTADGYWNGMALVNPGAADANATLTIVEENGNKGTLTLTVPAGGIVVKLVEKLSDEAGFVADAANTSPMGAARCYISVAAEGGNLKGFAMMADGAQSMGYTVP